MGRLLRGMAWSEWRPGPATFGLKAIGTGEAETGLGWTAGGCGLRIAERLGFQGVGTSADGAAMSFTAATGVNQLPRISR